MANQKRGSKATSSLKHRPNAIFKNSRHCRLDFIGWYNGLNVLFRLIKELEMGKSHLVCMAVEPLFLKSPRSRSSDIRIELYGRFKLTHCLKVKSLKWRSTSGCVSLEDANARHPKGLHFTQNTGRPTGCVFLQTLAIERSHFFHDVGPSKELCLAWSDKCRQKLQYNYLHQSSQSTSTLPSPRLPVLQICSVKLLKGRFLHAENVL